MAIAFLTGQRLTADLLNTNLTNFHPTTPVTKTVATPRNTTTTVADDPELQGIPLSVGTWEIDMLIHWTCTTTNTQGLKTLWGFTGTWNTTTPRDCFGGGANNADSVFQMATTYGAAPTIATQFATYLQVAGTAYGSVREVSRTVVVTAAGNLSFKWSQNLSSANNTTVQPGSNITIRKIA